MWFKSNVTTPAVAAISFCLIGGTVPTPAHADLGDQLFKLLPNDGAAEDWFGESIAMRGATAIVGTNSESAYLFDTTTGAQIAKLLADDGATNDGFGRSVAISGATAIVGAFNDDGDNGLNSGSAYLFDTNTGQQLLKLLADDGAAEDWFGLDVAISGPPGMEVAIVGAIFDDDNGSHSGSAYLFDASTGQQLFKLLPNDGAANDQFGTSVAISGATAIVGALLDDDNGENSGSAYLFDITTGRQFAKLLPNDGAAYDGFGRSVAISGATAIVGAQRDDDNGFDSGSAYLFDTATGEQIAKLLASDGAEWDWFGRSVAISGETAIVGAQHHDDNGSNSGSAYLFDTTTGAQIAKLLADDGAEFDQFGYSVGISGATAIVGARWDDDTRTDSGSAFLFAAPAAPDATLLFEPDQPYLSEADSPLDTGSAGFILENFEDGLFNIPGVSVSGGEVRFPGPSTDSVDLDDGVPDGFGTDGHSFLRSDGQAGITFTFDAKVLGQLPTQAGLVWTDGNPQAVVTFNAVGAQDISLVTAQATLGDDVHNGTTAEDRFFGVDFPGGIAAISISASLGGLEIDHVQFVVPCPWDLDASGDVGVKDLLILLGAWGPCPKKGDCPADFDNSGDVGVKDLLFLLGNWGPCP